MKKLFIISNENIFNSENEFYCDNIDLKSTPEGLNQKFEVSLIARKSKIIRAHKINIHNIKISKTIFSFLHSIYKTYRNDAEYLIISISPYTFISCLILKFLGKKPFVYLRSDGYGEYKSILGFFGPILYHLMFNITSAISNLISCRDYILKGRKGNIVNPSQLDNDWLCNYKKPNLEKINLLYVGRVRVEKGIFSLLN